MVLATVTFNGIGGDMSVILTTAVVVALISALVQLFVVDAWRNKGNRYKDLKTDIKDLKQSTAADIKDLKQSTAADIKDLKTDIKDLKVEFKDLKTDFKELEQSTAADIKELRQDMAANNEVLKGNFRNLMQSFNAFVGDYSSKKVKKAISYMVTESPTVLTEKGEELIKDSGLASHLDNNTSAYYAILDKEGDYDILNSCRGIASKQVFGSGQPRDFLEIKKYFSVRGLSQHLLQEIFSLKLRDMYQVALKYRK